MDQIAVLATDPAAWVALVTLIAMELVLGIDNLIFISILTNKLPEHQRTKGRRIGIGLALIMRIGLLSTVAFIVQLTTPLFNAFGHGFSWRDLILVAGGLFLVWKATKEIHHSVDPHDGVEEALGVGDAAKAAGMNFGSAIVQIIMLDIVFSIDSIITAVGMSDDIPVMIIAVIVAVLVMLLAADPLAHFIIPSLRRGDVMACPPARREQTLSQPRFA
jgi:predicted tellurium resistance membrane protein TerC